MTNNTVMRTNRMTSGQQEKVDIMAVNGVDSKLSFFYAIPFLYLFRSFESPMYMLFTL